jgi:hypothetical protein
MASLKDRLAQATSKLFGASARDVAVPFELLCDCGHRVAGIRRVTDQIVTCSACRSTLYVLPADVYPAVRTLRTEPKDGPVPTRIPDTSRQQRTVPVHEEPEQETSTDSPAIDGNTSSPEPRRRGAGRGSARKSAAETKAPGRPEEAESLVPVRRISFKERLRRTFSPTRLLAMGLITLLIGTGWWMVQRQRLEQARKTWRQEMDRVAPALKDGDFGSLQAALQKAVEAARVLNRTDGEAMEAESLLSQTIAIQSLTTIDLISTLSNTAGIDGLLDKTKASGAASMLQGQRFVFDTTLKPVSVKAKDVAGARSVPLMELHCPISANSIPIRIAIASEQLMEFRSLAPEASILFTATVESVRPPLSANGSWQIELDPNSCVLLTSTFLAERCGYDVATTEGLEKRMEDQKIFIRSRSSTDEKPAEQGSADQNPPASNAPDKESASP